MSLQHQENNSSSEAIVHNTISGLKKLVGRSFFVYSLKALSLYCISKWLTPADYGTFAILNNWVWAVALFLPDLALEAALIQQKGKVQKEQEETLFFISLWRALIILIFFVLFSSKIISYYQIASTEAMMLIYLSLGQCFSNFVIPHRMHFERELKFSQIITSDVVESITLYSVQIILAYLGFGVWSLVLSVTARSLVGLIMMNFMLKRIIIPKFHKSALKGILSFGVITQLKKIVLSIKTLIIPLLLGSLIGINDIGLITWSLGIALIPSVLAENYDRVLFPALSRLQNQAAHYNKLARNGLNATNYLLAVVFGGIAVVSEPLVRLIFSDNWLKAITLLPLAAFSLYLSKYRFLYCSILNSKGRPRQLLLTETFSTIFEILFCYIGLMLFSLKGYFYGIIITEICLIVITKFLTKDVIDKTVIHRFCICTFAMIASYYIGISISQLLARQADLIHLLLRGSVYVLSLHALLILLDKNFISDVKFAWKFKIQNL